jgi:hypothetical protein
MKQKQRINIDLGPPCFLSSKEMTDILYVAKHTGENQMKCTLGQPATTRTYTNRSSMC